jgi:hypothetical protein
MNFIKIKNKNQWSPMGQKWVDRSSFIVLGLPHRAPKQWVFFFKVLGLVFKRRFVNPTLIGRWSGKEKKKHNYYIYIIL